MIVESGKDSVQRQFSRDPPAGQNQLILSRPIAATAMDEIVYRTGHSTVPCDASGRRTTAPKPAAAASGGRATCAAANPLTPARRHRGQGAANQIATCGIPTGGIP